MSPPQKPFKREAEGKQILQRPLSPLGESEKHAASSMGKKKGRRRRGKDRKKIIKRKKNEESQKERKKDEARTVAKALYGQRVLMPHKFC